MYPPHFPTEYRPHLHPGMLQHHSSHRVPTIETSNRQTEVVDITKEETSDLVNLSPRAMPSQPSLLNFNNQARLPGAVQNGANPPSSKGDFDGLAAFLAARIRTKAELKQVCFCAMFAGESSLNPNFVCLKIEYFLYSSHQQTFLCLLHQTVRSLLVSRLPHSDLRTVVSF